MPRVWLVFWEVYVQLLLFTKFGFIVKEFPETIGSLIPKLDDISLFSKGEMGFPEGERLMMLLWFVLLEKLDLSKV